MWTLCEHTLIKHAFSLLLHRTGSCHLAASLKTPTWSPFSFFIPLLLSWTFLPCLSSGCRVAAELNPSICLPAAAACSPVELCYIVLSSKMYCNPLYFPASTDINIFLPESGNILILSVLRLMLTLLLTLWILISSSCSANVSVQGLNLPSWL